MPGRGVTPGVPEGVGAGGRGSLVGRGVDGIGERGAAVAVERAGVPVIARRYDGLIHGFFDLGALSPASAEAVAEICGDLRELLEVPAPTT